MGQLLKWYTCKGMHTYSSTMKVGIVCATEAIHIDDPLVSTVILCYEAQVIFMPNF